MSSDWRVYPGPVVDTQKRSAKRSQIVKVATKHFAERGYGSTRMEDIAAELEMKAGSLYYYFDSKEAILAAIVEENVETAVVSLREIVESEGSVVARIRLAIEAHLLLFDAQPDLYSLFNFERIETISPDLGKAVDDLGRAYEELWVELIAEGVRNGELRVELDPWLTMKTVVGVCNSTLFWFSPAGDLGVDEMSDSISSLVLSGLQR